MLKSMCRGVLVAILNRSEEMRSPVFLCTFQLDVHMSFWKAVFFFFFLPPPFIRGGVWEEGGKEGRRAAGAAALGADGDDRSWPLIMVWILNFNKSCSEGTASFCLEASFFPLRDLEIAADEIALRLASEIYTEYSIFS